MMSIVMFSQSVASIADFLTYLKKVSHVKMTFHMSFHVSPLSHHFGTGVAGVLDRASFSVNL